MPVSYTHLPHGHQRIIRQRHGCAGDGFALAPGEKGKAFLHVIGGEHTAERGEQVAHCAVFDDDGIRAALHAPGFQLHQRFTLAAFGQRFGIDCIQTVTPTGFVIRGGMLAVAGDDVGPVSYTHLLRCFR